MNDKEEIINLFESKVEEIYQITPEKQLINNKISKELEIFIDSLDNDQKEIFNKIQEYETEKDDLVHKQIFVYAFSLATKLFTEGLK